MTIDGNVIGYDGAAVVDQVGRRHLDDGRKEIRSMNAEKTMSLIHDFSNRSTVSLLGTTWRAVSDRVMGGVSDPDIAIDEIDGRACLRLTGDVRLENDGGFIQASLDLTLTDGALDASAFRGIRLIVRGNGERYSVHLRTLDNVRPWQSYRAHFTAMPDWASVDLPFSTFTPHRVETALDLERLRRLGLVAIGRVFTADLAIAEIGFYA